MNYTSGEWFFNKSHRIVETDIGELIARIYEPTGKGFLELEGCNKANANLIAAAPDMYEALAAICESKKAAPAIPSGIWKSAMQALGKAEGREV